MLIYTDHARLAMADREISEIDVQGVMVAPDGTCDPGEPFRECFHRRLGDRRISVIVEPDDGDDVVITVFAEPIEAGR